MKVNVIGNIFGCDGYSSHTKGILNALYKVCDCKLVTQLQPNWNKLVNDAELDMIRKPERKEDWNIIVGIPHMWKLFTGLGKNCGYLIWEGDKVPKSWIEEFMNPNIDMIFVPSEHTKQAIVNTLNIFQGHAINDNKWILDKIKIIHHGVDRELFYSQRKKDNSEAQNDTLSGDTKNEQGKTTNSEHKPVNLDNHADTFKFICNKGWRGTHWDRGGVQYVIKAFAEEFRKDEKVELMLKLNPAYINPQIIDQSMRSLNLPKDMPMINISCDNIPFNKLIHLYNQTDCYVCATRAEAFNLPGLEAMSCGLPTIQTNFGGQVDYMNDKNSLFIDYGLVEVKEDVMYEGISWAIPKIESLRKQMRWAFENQDKIKVMGKQAEEDSKNYTWDNSAKKIIEILN